MGVPALLIPNSVVFPPVECSRGVSPSQAAISRAFLNCPPLPAGGQQRRRRQRPDAWDRHQSPGNIVRGCNCFMCGGTMTRAPLVLPNVVEEAGQQLAHSRGQIVLVAGKRLREISFDFARALMHRDAILEAKGAHPGR
jgi:hypothetical protein